MTQADFHQSFANALKHPSADAGSLLLPLSHGDQRRRFDIYRNNRIASLVEALRSTYPVVDQLVGTTFFNASARAFIDACPPVQPVMAEYGREFGSFISSLPNTETLPFLNDIAELEWWKLQAWHSMDAAALQPSALADIAPTSIMDVRLQCHPAMYFVVSQWPVASIWTVCTQNGSSNVSETDGSGFDAYRSINMQRGEAVVITRPGMDLLINQVDVAGVEFLIAIQNGETLGIAAEQALERDIGFDAGEHLTGLIALGAFSGICETKTIEES